MLLLIANITNGSNEISKSPPLPPKQRYSMVLETGRGAYHLEEENSRWPQKKSQSLRECPSTGGHSLITESIQRVDRAGGEGSG